MEMLVEDAEYLIPTDSQPQPRFHTASVGRGDALS